MKYIKLFEAYENDNIDPGIRDIINWQMIEDIKEMALEYIDDGYTLNINIYAVKDNEMYRLYLSYNHVKDSISCNYIFSTKKDDEIIYYIMLQNSSFRLISYTNSYGNTQELVDRIKEAYPSETIIMR